MKLKVTEVPAGYSAMLNLFNQVGDKVHISWQNRIMGRNPLSDEALAWYYGVLGKISVGQELDKLKEKGFIVLHSVPLEGELQDVDHLVIAGHKVFVISTKYHNESRVSVVGDRVYVNGMAHDYISKLKTRADMINKIFEEKFREDFEVVPIMVFAKTSHIKNHVIRQKDVQILSSEDVIELLKSHSMEAATTKLSLKPYLDTIVWGSRNLEELEADVVIAKFEELRKAVHKANVARRIFLSVTLAVVLTAIYILNTRQAIIVME